MNTTTIQDFGSTITGAAKHRAQLRAATAPAATAPKKPRTAKPPRYNAYRGRAGGEFWIERKGDRAHRRLVTFTTREALQEFYRRPDYREELARLWDLARDESNVTEGKLRSKRNLPRVGPDYRNGVDVTPETFLDTFAPYGVQFGNWQRDRVACLNQTYDALLDLAAFLKLDPKALTFGGRLGIAFGARGKGKAAAHYETGHRVINLTKPAGAGCLAHEWFHAWDHHACLTAGLPGLSKTAALEKAVRNLPRGLKLRSIEADRTRSGKYYSLPHEVLARAFEGWVRDKVENDYLANIVKLEAFGCGEKRYPYPLPDELEQVDKVFRELFGLDR